MALHVSGKLVALGLVVTALITAFSAPRQEPVEAVPLTLTPSVTLLETPVEHGLFSVTVGPSANPKATLRATGYNSHASQTDSTPFITSTGARTRFGIVAVSRDLLSSDLPYGSLVRLKDMGSYYTGKGAGAFQDLLDQQGLFVVEDTMHARKTQQLDVWFPDYATAINWGVRRIEVELVRYGRYGPVLEPTVVTEFEATPRLVAFH